MYQKVLLTHFFLDILSTLVFLTFLIFLTSLLILLLTLSILASYRCKKSQKYPIQTNFFIPLNIYFVIDNLYCNKINMKLALYILSKQNFFLELLKKRIF